MIASRLEPLLKAETAAHVLALRTAEGLACQFEANDALQVFLEGLKRVVFSLEGSLVSSLAGELLLHFYVQLLNLVLISYQDLPSGNLASRHDVVFTVDVFEN